MESTARNIDKPQLLIRTSLLHTFSWDGPLYKPNNRTFFLPSIHTHTCIHTFSFSSMILRTTANSCASCSYSAAWLEDKSFNRLSISSMDKILYGRRILPFDSFIRSQRAGASAQLWEGHTSLARERPFTNWCRPDGRDPHDSWGTVLPRALLIGSCGFFTLP